MLDADEAIVALGRSGRARREEEAVAGSRQVPRRWNDGVPPDTSWPTAGAPCSGRCRLPARARLPPAGGGSVRLRSRAQLRDALHLEAAGAEPIDHIGRVDADVIGLAERRLALGRGDDRRILVG